MSLGSEWTGHTMGWWGRGSVLLVNSDKNSGEHCTRHVYILWSQEPLCIYLATHTLTAGLSKDKVVLKMCVASCLLFPPALHLLGVQWNGMSWSPCGCGGHMAYCQPVTWDEKRHVSLLSCRCETFLNAVLPLPLASRNTGIGGGCVSLDPGWRDLGNSTSFLPFSDLWYTGNVSEKELCWLLRF